MARGITTLKRECVCSTGRIKHTNRPGEGTHMSAACLENDTLLAHKTT